MLSLGEWIDLGWVSLRKSLISACGVWSEVEDPGETPHVCCDGVTYNISHEEMLRIQMELGLPAPAPGGLHDKFEAYTDENSCLNRAAFGEPIFVLQGGDEFAANLVRNWADTAEAASVRADKVADARLIADLMDKYPGRKVPG